jgi:hypothetical protein
MAKFRKIRRNPFLNQVNSEQNERSEEMKKIIEGKIYNTETATKVASYDNDLPTNDFKNYSESLYRTNKGAWFLAGEGGPMTPYSRYNGNTTSGGRDIIPLEKGEALAWLASHDETDAIEEYFADVIKEA